MISIIISAFCLATIVVFGSLIFKGGANPITLLVGRFFIATILIGVTTLFWNRKLFKVEKKDIKWFVLFGLVLFGQVMTYWYGFKIVKIVAIFNSMFFTYPIWIVILAWLALKRKISKKIVINIAIGLIGVLMTLGVIPNGISTVPVIGVLLGLTTAVMWGVYYLGSQILLKRYHLLTILFYNFLLTLLACSFLQLPSATLAQINPSVFWYLLFMAFIASYLAYLFLQYALKMCGAITISIQNMIQPAVALLLAFLFLQQSLNFFQLTGAAIIIFNIYLLYKWKN